MLSRKRILSGMVAARRSFVSSSRSFFAFSSTFGVLPGLLFGAESLSLPGHPGVALDRGGAHVEEAGRA
jgi:hypothetical protein